MNVILTLADTHGKLIIEMEIEITIKLVTVKFSARTAMRENIE